MPCLASFRILRIVLVSERACAENIPLPCPSRRIASNSIPNRLLLRSLRFLLKIASGTAIINMSGSNITRIPKAPVGSWFIMLLYIFFLPFCQFVLESWHKPSHKSLNNQSCDLVACAGCGLRPRLEFPASGIEPVSLSPARMGSEGGVSWVTTLRTGVLGINVSRLLFTRNSWYWSRLSFCLRRQSRRTLCRSACSVEPSSLAACIVCGLSLCGLCCQSLLRRARVFYTGSDQMASNRTVTVHPSISSLMI